MSDKLDLAKLKADAERAVANPRIHWTLQPSAVLRLIERVGRLEKALRRLVACPIPPTGSPEWGGAIEKFIDASCAGPRRTGG